MTRPRPMLIASLVLVAVALSVACGASSALAEAGAWWRLSSRDAPSNLMPGGKASIILTASNVGDGGVNATKTPVTITDELPAGLEAIAIRGAPAFELIEEGHQMTCELASISCTSQPESLPPFQALDVTIEVAVKPSASGGEDNKANVHGGEQQDAPGVPVADTSINEPIVIGGQPTPFGVEEDGYQLSPEEEGGAPDTRAGSHPFQLTTTLNLNQTVETVPGLGQVPAAPALPKNLAFNLPPGLLGNPHAVPACPEVQFLAITNGDTNECPPQSAIGVVVATINEAAQFHYVTRTVPLWNVEPAYGEPARLGFEVLKVPVLLDTAVRTGGDYGVTVSLDDAPQAAQILSSEVTIWGVPADQHHDSARGWACILEGVYDSGTVPCESAPAQPPEAFLTLPTSCAGPLSSTVEGQSWPIEAIAGEPGESLPLAGNSTSYTLPARLQDCEQLPFSATLAVQPEQQANESHARESTSTASTPTGLHVDVKVPQQGTVQPEALSEADIKSTTVTLPEGVLVNPSAANGLQACTEAQIGYLRPGPSADPLAPGTPEPAQFTSEKAACPNGSKVGTVRIKTPLLSEELAGAVYLATPAPQGEAGQNPFNTLIALYILAENQTLGLRVKLAGEGQLNPTTGQLTTTFQNTPQVPFEELNIELFGGPRASLSTPARCASYSTQATFTPWSGTGPLNTLSPPEEFAITTGPDGSPCPSDPLPFAPSFSAASTNTQAGAYTPFTLQIANPDGDQALSALTMHLPAGVAALLSQVTPCPEPQAAQNQCGPQSLIGHSTASSGLGPDPVQLPGTVYLTGLYEGAPFGLSVVTPAVAGPFNLGDITVRSRINVDPHTAQVTITSDPFPTFIKGVPAQLKQINVTVDRPNFEYNPTSCNPMTIAGTLTGIEGATSNVSSPFQVANCASLPFKPAVTASTQGKTSKADGASLRLKFTSHTGEAHVAKTILTIPAVLPARLSTIQKACLASVFEANPAGCPEGSDIGSAVVHTPVLKSPLTGPIYLVSHGNAAWPDAELVLQGEGITLILDGQTAIKKGITTSSFLSVPDAPFETVEATLPEGPHSALTTNLPAKDKYNLCGQNLTIPTILAGQNAAVLTQNARVSVQGCHAVRAIKTRKRTRAQKLTQALRACREQHKRVPAKRSACERGVRKRYTTRKPVTSARGSAYGPRAS
jgi:hypothetical protein